MSGRNKTKTDDEYYPCEFHVTAGNQLCSIDSKQGNKREEVS